MRGTVFNRKLHYWVSIVIAVPVLVVLVTGLMLQLKKQLAWIQPPEQRGTGKSPAVSFPQMLAACQADPATGVTSWDDISRIDVRPNRGLIKLTTTQNLEVQLDAGTGAILQVAVRRSDIIESFHDGSIFSNVIKYAIFLPSGVLLLVLWITGMILFIVPIAVRWRRKRRVSGS